MNQFVRQVRTLLVALISLFLGCGNSSGPEGFAVRGTIQNNTQTPIPGNARLVVVWVVPSGSPDYTYVFGEGTINAGTGSFELVMPDDPPSEALIAGALGVGILVVTTNSAVATGDDVSVIPSGDLLGAAGSYGLIYVTDPVVASSAFPWVADFPAGYGAAEGQEVGGGGFDIFVPTDPSSFVLTIDAWSNIEFVNWS